MCEEFPTIYHVPGGQKGLAVGKNEVSYPLSENTAITYARRYADSMYPMSPWTLLTVYFKNTI
jgi:hypothetical protein